MLLPAYLPLTVREGEAFTLSPLVAWTRDYGAVLWSAGATHALNDVITALPDTGLFYRATTAGTSAGSPPVWPTSAGQTVVDGSVTWTAQSASSYAVDLTGASAHLVVRSAPDDVNPPALDLTSGGGSVTLGGTAGTIGLTFTLAQVTALVAAIRYGYYDLLVTLASGVATHVLAGPVDIVRSAARS